MAAPRYESAIGTAVYSIFSRKSMTFDAFARISPIRYMLVATFGSLTSGEIWEEIANYLLKLFFSICTLDNLFSCSSLAEKYASDNGVDPSHVVLVGHSSGAQAALRYAEKYAVDGIVLVSATYSDLGDASERASGYYPQQQKNVTGEKNQYLFDEMKKNCPLWHQFHSDDDPFIPLREAERIRDGLGLSDTYHMLPGRSHFFDYSPELLDAVLSFFL
jgi:hypothetical protein